MKTHNPEVEISLENFEDQYRTINTRIRPLLTIQDPQKLISGITPQELGQLHNIAQFDAKTQDLFNQLVSGKITNEWKAFAIFTHFKDLGVRNFQKMTESQKIKLALEALALATAAKYYLARLYLSDKNKYSNMVEHIGDIGSTYWVEFGNIATSYLHNVLTTPPQNRILSEEWVVSALSGRIVSLHI